MYTKLIAHNESGYMSRVVAPHGTTLAVLFLKPPLLPPRPVMCLHLGALLCPLLPAFGHLRLHPYPLVPSLVGDAQKAREHLRPLHRNTIGLQKLKDVRNFFGDKAPFKRQEAIPFRHKG